MKVRTHWDALLREEVSSAITMNRPFFTELVTRALSAGADPNARDNWSYTPLHEAAIKGKIDVCIVLLQHGADHTVRNAEGNY